MDAPKIEQAITNLVSNAIEHTSPNSQVVIALSCDPRFITFSVKDQGPGIPSEEQEKLFKPFAKTSAKKTGGEKSTGLGMLITRKIIEAHRGQIWVDSQVGEGTTVYFKLPVNIEVKMNQDIKILIVDDDPDVLFATSRIVKTAGYEVLEASTGASAWNP